MVNETRPKTLKKVKTMKVGLDFPYGIMGCVSSDSCRIMDFEGGNYNLNFEFISNQCD